MEFGKKRHPRISTSSLDERSGAIFAIEELVRQIDMPVREELLSGIQPLLDTGFPGIDFLPPAHQADNCGPIGMTVHTGN